MDTEGVGEILGLAHRNTTPTRDRSCITPAERQFPNPRIAGMSASVTMWSSCDGCGSAVSSQTHDGSTA
jgi:hypothetical protein